ncbi:Uncharacterised protein [Vibrio cholerae]|nr:Uncharacterised protein [Vibrio cholerae]
MPRVASLSSLAAHRTLCTSALAIGIYELSRECLAPTLEYACLRRKLGLHGTVKAAWYEWSGSDRNRV